jgi:transcriptional regulator with GAF, ATPase, and Fis domain
MAVHTMAVTDSTVLSTGETGTGKEPSNYLTEILHDKSALIVLKTP